ncbi:DUF1080 domain-containing protein [Draconibacterium orientale]|uniref:3-keto-disaccharide hydrolase n=1 Tax=Draconibacterium orientale TaxID=1168034 RepID=UPI002ABE5CD6|nr:DUF1080 domain-containing protein [Draconibacterium orientale]
MNENLKYVSIHLIVLLVNALTVSSVFSQNHERDGYARLFNGKDLHNWDILIDEKGSDRNLFVVENETIHVYANKVDKELHSFGGIVTKKKYNNYILTLEYKWGTKKFEPRYDFVRDAGIIFHMHGEEKIWPNGVECQIQEGDTGDLWAIGTRVSSTVQNVIRNYSEKGDTITRGNLEQRFQRFHRAYCWEKPGWNKIEITVNEDQALFKINGKEVNRAINMRYWDEVDDCWQPLKKGKILLQAEGAEIHYRNVFIKELKDIK